MGLLLNFTYLIAAVLLSPWLLYRMLLRGDWRGFATRFGWALGGPVQGSIWLHGASAGEIALLKPLVSLLERDMPTVPLVISAYSSTGLSAAQNMFPRHRVTFLPFDFTFVVSRFLSRLDPCLIVVVESDFWPNFISIALARKIPVAVINGKISARSARRNARARFLPRLLRQLPLLAVQTNEHAERMRKLGAAKNRIRVTGNMKYDSIDAESRPEQARQIRSMLGYADDDVVIIGGSLHEREDQVLLDASLNLKPGESRRGLIMVPRYPRNTRRLEQAVSVREQLAVRKTLVDAGQCTAPGVGGVLIVDTVGELRTLYAAADIAFVGGSLFFRGSSKGGHNLMEPAILALPVIFGPYHSSFKDTVAELLEADAGVEVNDCADLVAALDDLVDNEPRRKAVGRRAREVVLNGQGATLRNYELLKPLLRGRRERLLASELERTMPPTVSETDTR
jgi:3-deoxy-D-manno-octulosonic-acid transferase